MITYSKIFVGVLWTDPHEPDKETVWIGGPKENRDHPFHRMDGIGKIRDQKGLVVTQTAEKNHQLELGWKTYKE